MNIKHRLKALETKANQPQPWLILDIDNRPTDEQQSEIDEAKRTGRFTICFEKSLNWAYVPGNSPAPWEAEV